MFCGAILCASSALWCYGGGEGVWTLLARKEQLNAEYVNAVTSANATLLEWLYPSHPIADIRRNYLEVLPGCKLSHNCFCGHVAGSAGKLENPTASKFADAADSIGAAGYKKQVQAISTIKTEWNTTATCDCFVNPNESEPCLFSDMKPSKVLAVLALARARKVTHIVEAGRYGGLSAAIYALHGFDVTSIEYLPMTMVTRGLRQLAPEVEILDGDDRFLVPQSVDRHYELKHRVAVVFDGSKRWQAYQIFDRIADKVVFAVFDDVEIDKGFIRTLNNNGRQRHQPVWYTFETSYKQRWHKKDAETLKFRHELVDSELMQGGLENLTRFQFAIVQAGAW
mmetsp:Transcript_92713/g.207241  ORF Transcript_92713/g.207241 Transcript_92713/m.207241 type:complete len:339 (-) Transcript_92713:130-1146(-)